MTLPVSSITPLVLELVEGIIGFISLLILSAWIAWLGVQLEVVVEVQDRRASMASFASAILHRISGESVMRKRLYHTFRKHITQRGRQNNQNSPSATTFKLRRMCPNVGATLLSPPDDVLGRAATAIHSFISRIRALH
jgi:hypothetical protein